MSRYEARLQRDLDEIHDMVVSMFDRVEQSVANAIDVVFSGNEELAYRTILGDEGINRLVRRIDQKCHAFIALHLPSAGHLRRISSTIRVNLQAERIGDYAVTMSREAVQLSSRPTGPVARELEMVATDSRRMLHQAIQAFTDANGEMARATMHMADNAEHTMDLVYADLVSGEQPPTIKDLVAVFAIYNMLKRVWDQAKNICEETVFAVLGETKPAKSHKLLFVDEDNSCLSQMAAAIATKSFPERVRFESAGRNPADSVNAEMVSFMESRGFDLTRARPRRLDSNPEKLAQYFVIVSLQGPVKAYIPDVPFHTSALTWDVGSEADGPSRAPDQRWFEDIYREIGIQVRDLMDVLLGEAA